MSSEQWLENGICSECRRQKYCQTVCSKAKQNLARKLNTKYNEMLAQIIGEQNVNIIDDGPYKPDFEQEVRNALKGVK